MRRILGLDLGTNSIGWALINKANEDNEVIDRHIIAADSRIIPMDAAQLGDFDKGNSVSQTAQRTFYRGMRRLRERSLLRRERLLRVLDLMGFLPPHFSAQLTRYGKFKDHGQPKIAWRIDADGTYQFVFKESFEEMLADFRLHQPALVAGGAKVPYDWTLYYLRKKALLRPITEQELAWVLLSFNAKRGYHQLRDEEEASDSSDGKIVTFEVHKVLEVVDTGIQDKKSGRTWYDVKLSGGEVYPYPSFTPPAWQPGHELELIVTRYVDKDGRPKLDKEGRPKKSFSKPKEDDWTLIMKKTEHDIDASGKHVGEYIYDTLLRQPDAKMRGGLVRHIQRRYYRAELHAILDAQTKFHPALRDRELYARCIDLLYPQNETHRRTISERGFTYLLADDILLYQRPLKSKKSLIANCPYEHRSYTYPVTGETKKVDVKCAPKSHPLFQDFRLWQFIANLRIYRTGFDLNSRALEHEVTLDSRFLPTPERRAELFAFLRDRKEVKEADVLKMFFRLSKDELAHHRWSYPSDKVYPAGETRHALLTAFKAAGVTLHILDAAAGERVIKGASQGEATLIVARQDEDKFWEHLWHVLYSIDDKDELRKALTKFAKAHGLGEAFVESFVKVKPFKKDYCGLSLKALRRLLPLMREGCYWRVDDIDPATRERIDHIVTGEVDPAISDRVRKQASRFRSLADCHGLPTWLACYLVYGRHSEASDLTRWRTAEDVDNWLKAFKHHSLRNPIVEQVILETVRVVRDILKRYGPVDEVHVELGREMKRNAEQRRELSQRIQQNEATNQRIRMMLAEFAQDSYGIEDVRPHSPSQQELLRIYEEGALATLSKTDREFDFVSKISKTASPTSAEVKRYKLWLEQRYRSPYTGEIIPLSRLFTRDYEVEHIIPQSRFFDDSLSNKVICESAVNKMKDRLTAHEFIAKYGGASVPGLPNVIIQTEQAYVSYVEQTFKSLRGKLRRLLMDDIPADFIERQLNDSRYISRWVMSLLSRLVREDGELEAKSRNVIVCTGAVTDRLKQDWGVNNVWNQLILPRFQRLNALTGTMDYTSRTAGGHEIPDMPLDQRSGFNKKRVDHRHHAMDAIVIACATREHVNLLNNEAALSNGETNANRHQLSHKLRRYEEVHILRDGRPQTIQVAREFLKPWPTFPADLDRALRGAIVSFKQNLRVITKTTNRSIHYGADGRKTWQKQKLGDQWAIRKPLHKETVYGEICLREEVEVKLPQALERPWRVVDPVLRAKLLELVKAGMDAKSIKCYFEGYAHLWPDLDLKRIKVIRLSREDLDPKTEQPRARYFATRKDLVGHFDKVTTRDKAFKKIQAITDSGIRTILRRHLEACGGNVSLAFSADGLEQMNANLQTLNGGKPHKPIRKVRIFEQASKFAVGQTGEKRHKFVEAAKGTNLFFAVYETRVLDKASGLVVTKRSFDTIPLYVAIERLKQGLPPAPELAGKAPTFVLSPGDLVYLPTAEERASGVVSLPLNSDRIYKMVKATGRACKFRPYAVAQIIVDQVEYEKNNCMERALSGEMVKDHCLPLKVDRLGKITSLNNLPYDETNTVFHLSGSAES